MHLSIITTFRCNCHCDMCHIWKHPTKVEEEFKPEVLEKLPNNIWRVNLTGGEPMLRDDIDDIMSILVKKAKLIEISTNGYFTDKLVNLANKYSKKLLIRVSIEGLPAVNDRLRGIKDGFDHALRTILELKEAKLKDIGFGIVISDKNAKDLISVYELCVYLGIELGNATMHNSWYFHKTDNEIKDKQLVISQHAKFMAALLKSKRHSIRMRAKDWTRAYFNKSIYRFLRGDIHFRPHCVAGKDMFFLDPWGNLLPCNGSDEPWIMGNLNNQLWEEIVNSKKAEEIRKRVANCQKTCVYVGTERFFMKRNPWIPIYWIIKNKMRLLMRKEVCVD